MSFANARGTDFQYGFHAPVGQGSNNNRRPVPSAPPAYSQYAYIPSQSRPPSPPIKNNVTVIHATPAFNPFSNTVIIDNNPPQQDTVIIHNTSPYSRAQHVKVGASISVGAVIFAIVLIALLILCL